MMVAKAGSQVRVRRSRGASGIVRPEPHDTGAKASGLPLSQELRQYGAPRSTQGAIEEASRGDHDRSGALYGRLRDAGALPRWHERFTS